MGHFYFIRHGESEANRGGWLAGHRDSPLTDVGRAQARVARAVVQAIDVQTVVVSDLSRAMETAQILLEGRDLPVHRTPFLRERAGGKWEGQKLKELREAGHLTNIRSWYVQPPEGESLHEVALRAVRALSELDTGQNVLVVAHGALLRAVLHAVDFGPGGELPSQPLANCELVQRVMPPGGWTSLLSRCEAHGEDVSRASERRFSSGGAPT